MHFSGHNNVGKILSTQYLETPRVIYNTVVPGLPKLQFLSLAC
jgi:hypothetical protein